MDSALAGAKPPTHRGTLQLARSGRDLRAVGAATSASVPAPGFLVLSQAFGVAVPDLRPALRAREVINERARSALLPGGHRRVSSGGQVVSELSGL